MTITVSLAYSRGYYNNEFYNSSTVLIDYVASNSITVFRDELTKLFYKTYNKQLLDETQTRRLWFVTTGFVKIQEPVRPLFKILKHAYIRHLAFKTIKCLLPTLLSHASFDLRLWSVL